MAKQQITLKNMPHVLGKLTAVKQGVLEVAGRSLYRSGEAIITISKEKYVPVDTGSLMNSLQASPPVTTKASVRVELSAGGPSAPYAVHVHETNKNYNFGRTWKYLQTPVQQNTETIRKNAESDILAYLAANTP
jgi:hypothetical protein